MKRVRYMFKVQVKSCAPGGGWVRSTEYVCDNDKPSYVIAGEIAAGTMDVTETGVRVEFLGLRAEGSSSVTRMNPFVLTLERS